MSKMGQYYHEMQEHHYSPSRECLDNCKFCKDEENGFFEEQMSYPEPY